MNWRKFISAKKLKAHNRVYGTLTTNKESEGKVPFAKFKDFAKRCRINKRDWVCSPGAKEATVKNVDLGKIPTIITNFNFQVGRIALDLPDGRRIIGGIWNEEGDYPEVCLYKKSPDFAVILQSCIDSMLNNSDQFITIIRRSSDRKVAKIIWQICPNV